MKVSGGMVLMANMSVSKTEAPGSSPGTPAKTKRCDTFADQFGKTKLKTIT